MYYERNQFQRKIQHKHNAIVSLYVRGRYIASRLCEHFLFILLKL